MKILTTKTHMNNLIELRRRKAELKARLNAEQVELRAHWQELRSQLRPSQIIASFAQSLFGFSEQPSKGGMAARLQAPLEFASDLLIGNTRTRMLFKIVTPLVLNYWPRLTQKVKGIALDNSKAKLYGTLRKSVASLRGQLKHEKEGSPQKIKADDIIQPS